jgi:hypothetical protein
MPRERKNNTGAMFHNDKKSTDKHPDRTGQALIDGVEYWISGWINNPMDGGQPYLNMSFKRKDQPPTKAPPVTTAMSDPRTPMGGLLDGATEIDPADIF